MGRIIRTYAVVGFVLTAVVFSAGCERRASTPGSASDAVAAGAEEPKGAVLARYGDQTFTEADLERELSRLNRRSRKALEDPERLRQFVENHVLARMIYQEGVKKGYDQSPDIVRQVEDLKRRLVIQKVMQEHQSAPVTDEEVRAYYDSHPEEFSTDRVKASHILVKDEQLANDLRKQLEEDPSKFEELAKEHSIDRSNADKGGDLGFFGRGRMVKEFEDAAFALTKDGEISPVVKTRFGYHIIKRTGREDGAVKPFDEVKNQIRIRLINEKRRSQTDDFLARLKSDAKLEIDTEALAKVGLGADDEGEAGK